MPAGPPSGHPATGDGAIMPIGPSRVFPFFLASTRHAPLLRIRVWLHGQAAIRWAARNRLWGSRQLCSRAVDNHTPPIVRSLLHVGHGCVCESQHNSGGECHVVQPYAGRIPPAPGRLRTWQFSPARHHLIIVSHTRPDTNRFIFAPACCMRCWISPSLPSCLGC